MTYRRRVLCLLYVLAVVPSCVRVRSWQETEEITMSRLGKRSSGFAFTSSEAHKAPHAKKPHEKKVPHHKRNAGWVEGAPGPSSHEGKACMGEGCTYDVMAFNAVGDGITDDTKVVTNLFEYLHEFTVSSTSQIFNITYNGNALCVRHFRRHGGQLVSQNLLWWSCQHTTSSWLVRSPSKGPANTTSHSRLTSYLQMIQSHSSAMVGVWRIMIPENTDWLRETTGKKRFVSI